MFLNCRTGKLVNLSLTEEIRNPLKSIRMYKLSWTVFGFHSVLNINKENSKFFIGGIPISFEAPSEIKYNTFAGQIEELMIESIPIGLWNFIDISSPQNLKPSKIMTGAVERYSNKFSLHFFFILPETFFFSAEIHL